jgi:hypothetical protein
MFRHTKLKITKVDRITSVNVITFSTFHILTPVSIWNVLKLVMTFTDVLRSAIVVLSFLSIPCRWHCHAETRGSEVTVLLGTDSAFGYYIKWKYWFKMHAVNNIEILLISNFHNVLNVVFFLLGCSPASEFYIPTFRNILYHLHRRCKQEEFFLLTPLMKIRLMKMELTECSDTSAHKIQKPGHHPKVRIQQFWNSLWPLSQMAVIGKINSVFNPAVLTDKCCTIWNVR